MDKVQVLDAESGDHIWVYPLSEWLADCAGYLHDSVYKHFLRVQHGKGATPEEAIAELRAKLGAQTRVERQQARLAAQQAKQAAKRPVGRPRNSELGSTRREYSADDVRRYLAGVLLQGLGRLETKNLSPEAQEIVNTTKRQVLGA